MHARNDTRRDFLRTMLAGGALVPAFPSVFASALARQGTAGDADAPILVLVQLVGGNDGLNTLVPYDDDHYRRARPTIGLAKDATLPLADGLGLHPSLAGLRALYDTGELALVQGVGYLHQSRSHFRGIEIWQAACDYDGKEGTGWLGRALDERCPDCGPEAAVAVDAMTPRAFLARRTSGVTFTELSRYRLFAGSFAPEGSAPADALFRAFNAIERREGGIAAGTRAGDDTVAFLQRTALDALTSSRRLAAAERFRTRGRYGESSIGRDLELVARLVGAGLPTRVYHVAHGNYDTHVDQPGDQARLLRELDAAWTGFVADMKAQGSWERVTLMTYSEFGRRLAENANKGTDHGSASILLVAGGGIRGGLHGTPPSLAPEHLRLGDPDFTTDYRSVYATVLERRLGVPSLPVLGREFPRLEFAG